LYAKSWVDSKPHFRLNPLCEEKKRLRALYQLAVDLHKTAIDEALLARSRASKEDYEGFRAIVDEAKNTRDAARMALERHKKEHGC
jgi:Rad3-related DNA helicase